MRYPPSHKAGTRDRIVVEAARLFRRFGYGGVGIDRIMAAAKLTRGGFYGHFRSKADLFVAVLRGQHDFTSRLQARDGRSRAALTEQAVEVVRGYLDPANRDRVGQGCALAALSVDVARAGPKAQAAYAETSRTLLAELARGLDRPAPDDPRAEDPRAEDPRAEDPRAEDPRALAALALSVGGLVLARGMGDDPLAAKMLAACRAAAERELRAPG